MRVRKRGIAVLLAVLLMASSLPFASAMQDSAQIEDGISTVSEAAPTDNGDAALDVQTDANAEDAAATGNLEEDATQPIVQIESVATPTPDADGLLFSEDFNGTLSDVWTLSGDGASVQDGVLTLDGSDSYAYLPNGYLDSYLATNQMTISMKVKSEMGNDNFFTFAMGQNSTVYLFMRTRPNDFRTAITTNKWTGESTAVATLATSAKSQWKTVAMVFDDNKMYLYIDGVLAAQNEACGTRLSDLGTNAQIAFGKPFYDGDKYFSGSYDDVKIWNRALTAEELSIDETESERDNISCLSIPNADDIRGNITLPLTDETGRATIAWESSDPAIVTDEAQGGKPAGVVTRGDTDKTVTLTAHVTYSDHSTEDKVFNLTVRKAPVDLDTDYTSGYLFAHFRSKDYDDDGKYEEDIYFGNSEDGLHWNDMNVKSGVTTPVLVSNVGTGGVRDPHIIRSADGDKYWLIATDLRIEASAPTPSWGDVQTNGSTSLVVWESEDMVNWGKPRLVNVNFPTAGCTWAPEAIYDESTGEYLVYWASPGLPDNMTGDRGHRIWCARTRDFYSFTEPELYIDYMATRNQQTIDTSIVKDGNTYYRINKKEGTWLLFLEKSTSLTGNWTQVADLPDTMKGEGATFYKLPDGTWCIMIDQGNYYAVTTPSLSEPVFTRLTQGSGADQYSFPEGFRHGTVMRLSQTEYNRVLAAYPVEQTPVRPDADDTGLFYSEDFNGDTDDSLTLAGNAQVTDGALALDGASGTYASLPVGWLDGLDAATISFDVKTEMASGNFFTLAIGQDNQKYLFLRTRSNDFYTAITTGSYSAESKMTATLTDSAVSKWVNVTLVLDGNKMYTYLDGKLAAKNENCATRLSDLGESAKIWFGRSFYSGDAYFKGGFDNINLYNRALTPFEIAEKSGVQLALINSGTVGTMPTGSETGLDEHNAVFSRLTDNVLTSYVKKYTYHLSANTVVPTDLSAIPLKLDVLNGTTLTVNGNTFENGGTVDLSKDATVIAACGEQTQTITVKKPQLATNAVLPGQFADPDIDKFGGRYWIFPTTDGFSGWSGTQFYAFSSDSLSGPWKNEGLILDVNKSAAASTNSVHSYEVPKSPWSNGSAWAPTIEEKNGKYYFYYCAKRDNGASCIGVAVADHPEGPYMPAAQPLITPEMCTNAGVSMGQTIDPSVFTDDDGKSYLYFGNGKAAVVELGDDMVSVKDDTMKNIVQTDGSSLTNFRESLTVEKVNGLYHFLWSCDDAGSPNYSVAYGVSDNPYGPVKYKYLLMDRDDSVGMLGTAHQSTLKDDDGRVYLAYHRFYTPLNIYTSGLGYHRETCIDEIGFDSYGNMLPMEPTMAGTDGPAKPLAPSPDETKPLEEADGALTLLSGVAAVADGKGGKMLSFTTGWNNTGIGHAAIGGEAKLVQSGHFTLMLDVNQERIKNIGEYDSRNMFTIGTADQYFALRLRDKTGTSGVLSYKNGGTVQTAKLSAQTPLEDWSSVAIVYDEDETSGTVAVYMNGKQVLAPTAIGFKLSSLSSIGVNTYLARSYGTNYLFSGYMDDILLKYEALSARDAQKATAERALARDAEAIALYNINDVRGNLTLPEQGTAGSVIRWTSSRPTVISDSAKDGKSAGVVNRPAAGSSPVMVKLTAIVSNAGTDKTETRTFTATVHPLPANPDADYTGTYLWTHFAVAGGYEKIFFGSSEDGLHWNKLNVNKPILTNDGGDLGVRDPYLIRSAEGDRYWIIGTDLHAEGGGEGGSGWNQVTASRDLVVWESTDLVHWSKANHVFAGFDFAGCVWAPEAIYDKTTGEYLVYWAARDQRDNSTDNWALRVYLTRTRDFNTFTEPVVWLDEKAEQGAAGEINIIDTTITENNGTYYRFSTSDWFTILDKSDSLSGPWTRIIARGEDTEHGITDQIEGITCYQLPNGEWCVMGDHSAYRPFVTDNLASGQFTKVEGGEYAFSEKFRHGSVLRLSKTEEARVMAAFGEGGAVETAYDVSVFGGIADPERAAAGETVTVTAAAPESGMVFSGWTGDDVAFAEPSATATTFVMPAKAVQIHANFKKKSSGGLSGGSSSSDAASPAITTTTAMLDDGSKVTTVINAITGEVTKTVEGKDGSKTTVNTAKTGEMTATVKLAAGKKKATVLIPLPKATAGTVAMLVKPDGTEQVVTASVVDNGVLKLQVTDGETLHLVDNSKTMNDVGAAHWAKDAVDFATSRELFSGTGEHTFSPELSMTRGMLATVLYRMAGKPAAVSDVGFSDVARNQYYADAVKWAAENEVVTGITGDSFAPEARITREQLAVMLYRYAGSPAVSGSTLDAFADHDAVSAYARDAMEWVITQGILKGKTADTVVPQIPATRAEVAVMLERFVKVQL